MSQITAKELEDKFGITVRAEFVPWSKSRNFKPKEHIGTAGDGDGKRTFLRVGKATLNWKVTLCKDGRDVITTDYSAGIGHAPSYKNYDPKIHGCKLSLLHATFLEHEVEKGTVARRVRQWVLAPGVCRGTSK